MAKQVVYEDEEDWLVPYLASTEYGKDPRINSKPAPATKATKQKLAKKRFSLNLPGGPSSRRVASVPDLPTHVGNLLPERVNAIRDTEEEVTGNKHFVRYHSECQDAFSAKKGISSRRRRETLDYDELDAVRER